MNKASVKPVQVLLVGHPECGADFSTWAADHACVRHVDTFEEALEALRGDPFDIIISRPADVIPLQDRQGHQQAAAIIDSVSHGVCIVGESGALDWANPKMLAFSDDVRARVCRCCTKTFTWAQREARVGSSDLRGRRFSFSSGDNQRIEVTATPVIDLHNRVTQVAAVVWDATKTGRLQEKIDAIDQAGRELLSLDAQQFSRLDPQERLALLEQKILRCTNELLHFDNFGIFVIDEATRKLDVVLSSGRQMESDDLEIYAEPEGNGIRGFVAARGRSYLCPDTTRDRLHVGPVDGVLSSLTVPLWRQDKVVGVAHYESPKVAAFTEDDRQFAEIFGRYIALALHMLQLLASERHTTTGRLGASVMTEITAPVNDILTDVENLVEDYIGHDDLRHRLRTISENAVKIREIINDLTSTRRSVLGVGHRRADRRDPVLAGRRVLIADDEQMLRETVRDVLRGYGCHVETAENGAVAIQLIERQAFDLVLSDIKMPERNGYEVFAAAKDANPKTPVILTTGFGYDPNHTIVRARREGLAAVLFKPFKVDQLLSEIRTALTAAS